MQLIGIRYFKHSIMTWSIRSRGSVQRTHIITNTSSQPLKMKTVTLMMLARIQPTSPRPKLDQVAVPKIQEKIAGRSLREAIPPAAEKHDVGDAADGEHAAVLGHEDDQPAEAGVFGVKAGDQFAFRSEEHTSELQSPYV